MPLPNPSSFLKKLFAALLGDGIAVQHLQLDHLCYRVPTIERYAWWKAQFAHFGTLLTESRIGGRPIAVYRLHQAISFQGRTIEVVELPAPKPDNAYSEGYEHAEFVVHEDLMAFAARHPALNWDLRDMYKATNPDVRLRYPDFSVKFHRRSLAQVIAAENGAAGC